MFIFLFLASFLCSEHDEWQNVIRSIKELKNKTNYSTYYELFDVSEGASFYKIKKNYMAMIRKPNPIPSSFLPKHEQVDILTQGFNILRKKRSAYDYVLSNSKWLYDDRKNYENTKIIICLSLLALLVGLDIVYYSIRYVRYCTNYEVIDKKEKKGKSKDKKEKKVSATVIYGDKPQMYIYKIYNFLKNKLL
ncbi:hypothetical protein NBO_206g0001 [Nosema bombycis CQ1]|uniref:J domain-containing protein n=1 Tax=Nosema bombycis (strain CQ1 / CVCC 102059) TaxID=578461 RepID=R0KS85_NOSB1|nr:hypothetical protein NBO_206g0001 [Nosema bombycis CQ1]|eukprot:EOB13077.1 hypothetical protein NBO_206g0001 [Nosema bombycis CQ1]